MCLPRYRLSGMLAVTAIMAFWMWRQVEWIKERRELFASKQLSDATDSTVTAPGLLWLFGEHGHSEIYSNVPPQSEGDAIEQERRLTLLFPEASGIYVEIYCPPSSFSDEDDSW